MLTIKEEAAGIVIDDGKGHKIVVSELIDGIVVENLSKDPCQYQSKEHKNIFLFKGPEGQIHNWKTFELIIR